LQISVFLCGAELVISSDIEGFSDVLFNISDNNLIFVHRFFDIKINITSGAVSFEKTNYMMNFLHAWRIQLEFTCPYMNDHYQIGNMHEIKADINIYDTNIKSIGNIIEKLYIDAKYLLSLNYDNKSTNIIYYTKSKNNPLKLDVPLIDIRNTTLEKIEQKLRTYVLFS
jgi:hypothetical protein